MDIDNITAFLSDLSANNNKEWMDANKKWYKEAKAQFEQLVAEVLNGIILFDPALAGLEPKKCIFRVNRDIRFSKDKSPYKTNFGAAMAEGGRKSGNPLYYLHLEPGRTFVAGGIYMPEAEPLKKIRQEIDYNPEELKRIVEQPEFMKVFGGIQGEKLKTAPKGYPRDHPNIELLKHKSYIVVRDLDAQDLDSKVIVKACLSYYEMIKPFNDYLSVAIS